MANEAGPATRAPAECDDDVIMRSASSSGCGDRQSCGELLRVATWNVAAVNNNPFEYWVTHPDPEYNALMEGVQGFIDQPGERDVAVHHIFSDAMATELFEDMAAHKVAYVDEVAGLWQADYRGRRIISEFLKDSDIGKKRLASMPDRITNTIRTSAGDDVMRPAVINYYSGDMATMEEWWAQWRRFMFHSKVELCGKNRTGATPILNLLDPISAIKYPALTKEEERISIPLQMLALAIFDAILLHIINSVSKDSWQGIRASLALAFRVNKEKQVHPYPRDSATERSSRHPRGPGGGGPQAPCKRHGARSQRTANAAACRASTHTLTSGS